jgi:hypothetical protein
VLGAGNANDIDLAELLQAFERITLIDLDDNALQRATERLSPAERKRIVLRGGTDLTGVLPMLSAISASPREENSAITVAINAARQTCVPIVGTFDVVASTCVLTQLIDSIYIAIPTASDVRHELVMAIRNRHLDIIAEMMNPLGRGIVFTDFVGTETAPELPLLSDSQLAAAAARWINERNFFTGANPYAIRDQLQRLSLSGRSIRDVEVIPAWRWDLGAKQLAVSAVTFRT